MEAPILFKETQKFTQWWLWVFILLPGLLRVYTFIAPIFNEISNSPDNFSVAIIAPMELWIGFLVWIVIILFLKFSKLKTNITEAQIQIQHLLFVKRIIKVKDIAHMEMVQYGFLGYGIRISAKYGTVYNVKGNKGLSITLKSGKKYLIGTQNPASLLLTMKQIME